MWILARIFVLWTKELHMCTTSNYSFALTYHISWKYLFIYWCFFLLLSVWLDTKIFQTFTNLNGSFVCNKRHQQSQINEESHEDKSQSWFKIVVILHVYKIHIICNMVFMNFNNIWCILCCIPRFSKSYITPMMVWILESSCNVWANLNFNVSQPNSSWMSHKLNFNTSGVSFQVKGLKGQLLSNLRRFKYLR